MVVLNSLQPSPSTCSLMLTRSIRKVNSMHKHSGNLHNTRMVNADSVAKFGGLNTISRKAES